MRKKKSVFVTILLTAVFLLGGAMAAHADFYDGYFDDFEDNAIVGWGWDYSSPNTAVPVHVTVTNKDTGKVVGDFNLTAASFRADLKENGIGAVGYQPDTADGQPQHISRDFYGDMSSDRGKDPDRDRGF